VGDAPGDDHEQGQCTLQTVDGTQLQRFDLAAVLEDVEKNLYFPSGSVPIDEFGYLLMRLEPNNLPIKYLGRALSAVLVLSVLVFLLSADAFTYSLGEHVSDQLENSYRCLLVFPFLLGMGYYLFHERPGVKLVYSLAIELYFFVMIPHKVILHIIILHFGTRLAMPLLYICLGSSFDMLAFIALYAWALSNLPPQRQIM